MDVRRTAIQDDWGESPMRTRRKTGEVFFNRRYLERDDLTPDDWRLYWEHERGHIVLDTRDELLADAYAREQYYKAGKSLQGSISAMRKVLNPANPAHRARILQQILAAAEYDCHINKNCRAMNILRSHDETRNMTVDNSLLQGIKDAATVRAVTPAAGASVMQGWELSNMGACGERPKPRSCSGGPLKRKQCEETNRAEQRTWQQCIDRLQQNQEVNKQLDNQAEQVKQEIDSSKTILKNQLTAQQIAEQEETKRAAQSNTPMVVAVIAIVAGVALAMFFLFSNP